MNLAKQQQEVAQVNADLAAATPRAVPGYVRDLFGVMEVFAGGPRHDYTTFRAVWKRHNVTLIFSSPAARVNPEAMTRAMFRAVLVYTICSSDLRRRVGGLYTLFMLYGVNPSSPRVKIPLPLDVAKETLPKLESGLIESKAVDAYHVLRKMRQEGCFQLSAEPLTASLATTASLDTLWAAYSEAMWDRWLPPEFSTHISSLDFVSEPHLAASVGARVADSNSTPASLLGRRQPGASIGDLSDIPGLLENAIQARTVALQALVGRSGDLSGVRHHFPVHSGLSGQVAELTSQIAATVPTIKSFSKKRSAPASSTGRASAASTPRNASRASTGGRNVDDDPDADEDGDPGNGGLQPLELPPPGGDPAERHAKRRRASSSRSVDDEEEFGDMPSL